jgi:hypothetical protein
MKILLQNRETRRYVAKGDNWSENTDAALVFPDLAHARQHGSHCGLSGLRIVALLGCESAKARTKSLQRKGNA